MSDGQNVSRCTTCGAPLVGDNEPLDDARRFFAPYSAVVSWTYVRGERAEESLLRIRRELKEAAGWWNEQDERDYIGVIPNG